MKLWAKIQSARDPFSRGLLERFSEGFWSQECVPFHLDPLRSWFIPFVNAPWFQCTFVSKNSNSCLKDCSWATEACLALMRRTWRVIHKAWWSLNLLVSVIQERASLNRLLSGTFTCLVTLVDGIKADDDKPFLFFSLRIEHPEAIRYTFNALITANQF